MIDIAVPVNDLARLFFHDPVDLRFRKVFPQHFQEGEGMDDIPYGAQFDDKNALGPMNIQNLIPLDDPTDRVQEIPGGVSRLFGLLRKYMVDLAHPVTGFDQDTPDPGTVRKLYIVIPVSNHKGTGHVDIKGSEGLLDEACFRLSAITGAGICLDDAKGVVRAEKNAVDGAVFILQRPLQEGVDLINQFQRMIATRYARLVGYDDGKEAVLVQEPHGLGDTGEEHKTTDVVDVPHLLIDGSISIDKNCGFFHFILSLLSKISLKRTF